MTLRKKGILLGLEIGTPIVLVLLWWTTSVNSQSIYFPPLAQIFEQFQENWLGKRVLTDFLPSLGRMFGGYFLAVIIGVGLGMLLGLSHTVRQIASPLVSFLRSIPGAALLPPAVALLGIGHGMKIAIIAFICLWPILLNTIDGIDETHPTQKGTAQIFRIDGMKRFLWITVPAASPRIFAGLKTSLGLALIMLVISEMIASTGGLGFFILQAQRTFDTAGMWSGIILLGLLGYVLTLLFEAIQGLALRWYSESKKVS